MDVTEVDLQSRLLVVRHAPAVYALGEWAGRYDPATVGLAADEVELLNDDRVGRMLSRLFDADRASLLTRLVLDAVDIFDIDLSRLHNDSTSLKLSGAYEQADGHERAGKPTPAARYGFSKDHRPDLKQFVWILTVTADGAVPITFRIADGNTADVTTHIDTWNTLVALTGRTDFLYTADRGCAAPTTARLLEIFAGVARHELTAPDGQVLRTFHPELTELQQQVLDLLDIPTIYSPVT